MSGDGTSPGGLGFGSTGVGSTEGVGSPGAASSMRSSQTVA
jgi:hypothetical protein